MSLIQKLVSKKKRRFDDGEFNLDLSYITSRVIAMGFPSIGQESLYRNPMSEVQIFFRKRHGIERVLVVNLCAEKEYDTDNFANVCRIGFRDHNAPPLSYLLVFCRAADAFLQMHEENIVAVHCKAGKGRTGVMICALLLYAGYCQTADEALTYYGNKRTHNGKGVTIPSQQRYVRYLEQCLRHGLPKRPYAKVRLRKIVLLSVPRHGAGSVLYFLFKRHESTNSKIGADKEVTVFDTRSASRNNKFGKHEKNITFEFQNLELQRDIKLLCIAKGVGSKDKKLFWCWFNTSFVASGNFNGKGFPSVTPKLTEPRVCVFKKDDLDKAHKDKGCKYFASDFTMTMHFEVIDPGTWEKVSVGKTAELGEASSESVSCRVQ